MFVAKCMCQNVGTDTYYIELIYLNVYTEIDIPKYIK